MNNEILFKYDKEFFPFRNFSRLEIIFPERERGDKQGKKKRKRGSRHKDELGKNGRVIEVTEGEEWEEEKKTKNYEEERDGKESK